MSFWRGVIAVIVCTFTQFVSSRLNSKEDNSQQVNFAVHVIVKQYIYSASITI
jgi:hypothetical protein